MAYTLPKGTAFDHDGLTLYIEDSNYDEAYTGNENYDECFIVIAVLVRVEIPYSWNFYKVTGVLDSWDGNRWNKVIRVERQPTIKYVPVERDEC
jgi:hypothetical protein